MLILDLFVVINSYSIAYPMSFNFGLKEFLFFEISPSILVHKANIEELVQLSKTSSGMVKKTCCKDEQGFEANLIEKFRKYNEVNGKFKVCSPIH